MIDINTSKYCQKSTFVKFLRISFHLVVSILFNKGMMIMINCNIPVPTKSQIHSSVAYCSSQIFKNGGILYPDSIFWDLCSFFVNII